MDTESPAQRLSRRIGASHDRAVDPPEAEDADQQSDVALARWLPDGPAPRTLGDRVAALRADPGRAGVMALIGVGVMAVLVTVFTVVRSPDHPVSAANLPPVQMVSTASSPPAAPPGPVVVSVVGLVNKPGLVTLEAGGRVADAVELAGGALDGADLVGLNMARRVADGEQIIVGLAAPPGSPSPMGSSVRSAGEPSGPAGSARTAATAPGTAGTDGSSGRGAVNLNTATADELDALPGVGPVTAAAIIAWRDANGPFGSVDQLGEVDGIGPARLDKLRDLVVA
ncbi:ComEA family DNA-binding protein [Mycolicibacterium neoaurum]|uniref:ComEA family DNA-binding protein n=1 Tax=Mycolicibacterium neoaurum TaxID=1795 RepID=UPI0026710D97|nr:ComEA family DNA-binding protein [Mycolicibacterium neoaurum]MDO3398786.1 ComEA family DNA-binding protein [Mycolicibacterium neoaurum]